MTFENLVKENPDRAEEQQNKLKKRLEEEHPDLDIRAMGVYTMTHYILVEKKDNPDDINVLTISAQNIDDNFERFEATQDGGCITVFDRKDPSEHNPSGYNHICDLEIKDTTLIVS